MGFSLKKMFKIPKSLKKYKLKDHLKITKNFKDYVMSSRYTFGIKHSKEGGKWLRGGLLTVGTLGLASVGTGGGFFSGIGKGMSSGVNLLKQAGTGVLKIGGGVGKSIINVGVGGVKKIGLAGLFKKIVATGAKLWSASAFSGQVGEVGVANEMYPEYPADYDYSQGNQEALNEFEKLGGSLGISKKNSNISILIIGVILIGSVGYLIIKRK